LKEPTAGNYAATPVMGYDVYALPLHALQITGQKTIVITLNAFSFVAAKKDAGFSRALASSDLLIADGFPMVLAARLLNKVRIEKIAGNDIFHYLLQQLNRESGSCFFLGTSPQTLLKIELRLSSDYPNVSVFSYSPPYKPEFTEAESTIMVDQVNRINPDVLFVGMTAPKQEKWVYDNQHLNRALLGVKRKR
jgi:N-acetylglucosaminyldiphosphoundecaprenol N-acetyl-beta-D-mannosaminyltransferase